MSTLIDTKDWTIKVKAGGKKYRELREQRDATQDDVAAATGIPKSLIGKYEAGHTKKPNLEYIVRLYGALGLDPNRAASDFGLWEDRPTDTRDPRAQEMQALVNEFLDHPESREEFINFLLSQAQYYAHQKRRELALK